ncbi:LysR family transcriptional regulator [Roseomonas elaeocarpi]|uniref:LysR family transcriptional regulator n=1 Tax=Roseomonas elaeocarpi TaxID=907779 RepID=A0ABV6JQC3_9PROT
MELDWLEDFRALAETRNFSRAAEARHVSQPAFSRRIRALEDWVGTALFHRHPAGAELTAAGAHFRPLAATILQDLARARRDTRAAGGTGAEALSIAATHALSFTFFPAWIRQHRALGAPAAPGPARPQAGAPASRPPAPLAAAGRHRPGAPGTRPAGTPPLPAAVNAGAGEMGLGGMDLGGMDPGEMGTGAINLVSDSLEACERLLLRGEVQFLLCHHHPAMPLPLEPGRFPSLVVGRDTLVPLCAPDARGRPAWPLRPRHPTPERAGMEPAGSPRDGAPRAEPRGTGVGRGAREAENGAGPTRLLGYSEASGLGRILRAAGHGTARNAGEVVFTSHLAATLMTMARQGHGLAWLPLTLAEEEIEAGRLLRAAPARHDIALEIRLFRDGDRRAPAAEQLWQALLRGGGAAAAAPAPGQGRRNGAGRAGRGVSRR